MLSGFNPRLICQSDHLLLSFVKSMSNFKLKKQGDQNVEQLSNLDHLTTNASPSQCEVPLYIFEDNERVIKMIIKGRSPMLRYVSRTHRVALDWLFDRINLEPKIPIKYVDTKNQLADILPKGSFTHDQSSSSNKHTQNQTKVPTQHDNFDLVSTWW